MNIATVLSLVAQISAFLKAVPALTSGAVAFCGKAASFVTAAEPYVAKLFPKLAGFTTELVAALTYVSVHGVDAVAEVEHVIGLLDSLDPAKPAPAPATAKTG